jgi:peptide subunit release factor 1 (eRF1)
MTSSHQEILSKALEIGNKAEMEREKHLVEKLVTQASKHSNAIVGLEPTLGTINEGRVQTLVIRQGFQKAGFRCPQCNTLTSLSEIVCKQCGSEAVQVADVIATAVSVTMKNGGEVDVVKENKAFEDVVNIGAFLRY